MLSAKEQLQRHIEELPNELAEEVLDFLLFVKNRRDRPGNNGSPQSEDISPLESWKTYDLPTPYNSYGVGKILMQKMKQKDED